VQPEPLEKICYAHEGTRLGSKEALIGSVVLRVFGTRADTLFHQPVWILSSQASDLITLGQAGTQQFDLY
jgi:hypothetical protein